MADVFSTYFHVCSFFLQSAALACRTNSLAPIACQHYPILYLILIFFKHFEEGVYTNFVARTMPEIVFLFLCKFVIWCENREVVFWCFAQEFLKPFTHLFSSPAHHGAIIDTKGSVWYYQMFVYAYNLSESFACRTCSDWGIERKHLVCRFFEFNTVCLEFCTEAVKPCLSVGHVETQHTRAVAFVHGCLG